MCRAGTCKWDPEDVNLFILMVGTENSFNEMQTFLPGAMWLQSQWIGCEKKSRASVFLHAQWTQCTCNWLPVHLLSPNHHPSKVLIKSYEYVGIGNCDLVNMYI